MLWLFYELELVKFLNMTSCVKWVIWGLDYFQYYHSIFYPCILHTLNFFELHSWLTGETCPFKKGMLYTRLSRYLRTQNSDSEPVYSYCRIYNIFFFVFFYGVGGHCTEGELEVQILHRIKQVSRSPPFSFIFFIKKLNSTLAQDKASVLLLL